MGHEEEGEEEEGAGEMCARRHGASASADGCSPGSLHTQRESQTASRNYFFIEDTKDVHRVSFVPSVRSAKFLQIETTHQLTFPRSLRNSQSLCSHFCTLFCLISPVIQRFTLQPTRTPTHTLAHLFPPRSPVPPPPPFPSKHPWGVCHTAYSTGPPVTMEEAVARACA